MLNPVYLHCHAQGSYFVKELIVRGKNKMLGGELMAIRDYWIYQDRNVTKPWALYVVKQYDKRHPETTTLDYTLYHENIEEPTNAFSRVGVFYSYVGDYVNTIVIDILSFGIEFENPDYAQLEREVTRILND